MISISIVIIIALCFVIVTTPLSADAISHHHGIHEIHCKPPYTRLYVYTYPVETECVLLMHNGKVVQAQNGSNTNNSTGSWRWHFDVENVVCLLKIANITKSIKAYTSVWNLKWENMVQICHGDQGYRMMKMQFLRRKYYKTGWMITYLVFAVMIAFGIIHYFMGLWLPD